MLGECHHVCAVAAADFKGVGLDEVAASCLADRSVPLGGSVFSVGVGGSYRQVLDFDAPLATNSLFVSAPGQSGSALSEWYDNTLPTWEDGDYLHMRTTSGPDGYRVKRTQTLLPS